MEANEMDMFKVTADDFGYCMERNRGIIELVNIGVIKNISVIINGKYVDKIKADSAISLGLHFNVTEGTPISHPEKVLSLLTHAFMFLGKFGFREKLISELVTESELCIEMDEQIRKFVEIYGHMPHYVDGHQHVHVLPRVNKIIASCMTKYGIRETRIPYEIGLSQCDWIEKARLEFYEQICMQSRETALLFDSLGIRYPKYFIGLSTMSCDMSIRNLQRALGLVVNDIKEHEVKPTVHLMEIMAHPGYPSKANIGGCGSGPDDFSCSKDRLHELEVLKSKRFKEILIEFQNGITVDDRF